MVEPIGLMEAGGLSQDAPVYATTLILVRHIGVLTTLTVVLAVRLDTWLTMTGMFVPVLFPCTYIHRDPWPPSTHTCTAIAVLHKGAVICQLCDRYLTSAALSIF